MKSAMLGWLVLGGVAVGGGLLVASTRSADATEIHVYKTATCGCCNGWVEHLRENGFTVTTEDVANLPQIKEQYGVPRQMSSCHTAIVNGYVVEGHVPADAIARLLAEAPAVTGIAVPGMPVGSPGMEGPNPVPYEVVAFDRSGRGQVFERYGPAGQ